MNNKLLIISIIFIGIISNIFPQTTFRSAVYLSQSVGTHIYDHSQVGSPGFTTVPNEVTIYNSNHGYTGTNAFTIYNPTNDYPPGGNQMWKWKAAFYDEMNTTLIPPQPYNFKEDYLDTETYNIIMIKFCAASQSDIWGYGTPSDTINFPQTQTIYNYQWYIRKIVSKMEEYPNKFFFLWNIPPTIEVESSVPDAERLAWFNAWMVDTLATGLDTSITTFPNNIKIFDIFSLLKSQHSNFTDSTYRDSPTDYHPNALASSVVAPILVQQMFDAAIAYEGIIPVELTSFTGDYEEGTVNLKWITATETNNSGFEIERRNDYSAYESIGFVKGNGTSTNKVTYNFIDDNLSSNKYYYRLKQIDLDGTFDYSNEVQLDIEGLKNYQLFQNYPNPFNPITKINFALTEAGNVKLSIYNILGQEIRRLLDEYRDSGNYTINFDADELNSGMYIYKLEVNGFVRIRKMALIK